MGCERFSCPSHRDWRRCKHERSCCQLGLNLKWVKYRFVYPCVAQRTRAIYAHLCANTIICGRCVSRPLKGSYVCCNMLPYFKYLVQRLRTPDGMQFCNICWTCPHAKNLYIYIHAYADCIWPIVLGACSLPLSRAFPFEWAICGTEDHHF